MFSAIRYITSFFRRYLILFLLLFAASCSGFQIRNQDDVARARQKTESGEDLSGDILRDLNKIPPELQGDAIDVAAARDTEKSRKALRSMLENEQIGPQQKQKVAHYLADRGDTEAIPLIKKQVNSGSLEIDKPVAGLLIKEDSKETSGIIFKGIEEGKLPYNDEFVTYLGKNNFDPAVEMISNMGAQNRHPGASYKALALMQENEKAKEILLSAVKDSSHPARENAIRALSEIKNKDEAKSILSDILKKRAIEPDADVIAAAEASGNLPEDPDVTALLREAYSYGNNEALRTVTLNSMAKTEGKSKEAIADEMNLPLVEYQSRLAFLREGGDDADATFLLDTVIPRTEEEKQKAQDDERKAEEEKRLAEEEKQRAEDARIKAEEEAQKRKLEQQAASDKKTIPSDLKTEKKEKHKNKSKAFKSKKNKKEYRSDLKLKIPDDKYEDYTREYLKVYFGEASGKRMYNLLNSALVVYSKRSEGPSEFILRAYKHKYNKSEDELRAYMAKGLSHPGALGAIIEGLDREYNGDKMKQLVLSQFFALKRWQSEILVQMIRERGF